MEAVRDDSCQQRRRQDGGREAPHSDWARHAIRINDIIDNQVRSLRARQVIDSFKQGFARDVLGDSNGHRRVRLGHALPCPLPQTTVLAETPTRLKKLPTSRRSD